MGAIGRPSVIHLEQMRFSCSLDESLAFLIIMLTAKYNIDFYKMFRLVKSSEE